MDVKHKLILYLNLDPISVVSHYVYANIPKSEQKNEVQSTSDMGSGILSLCYEVEDTLNEEKDSKFVSFYEFLLNSTEEFYDSKASLLIVDIHKEY